MLRQRPPISINQSAMFTKKQKKRSTSTSRNKQNMSISHNQSSSIEYSLTQEKNQQNIKSIKVTNKQKTEKTKKTKIIQIKQRSISRISNQASTLQFVDNFKILNLQNKQSLGVNKKPKIKNTDDNHLHTKSYIIHQASYQSNYKNQKRPIKQQINEPILSKTSTIISASTGNIQFSDRSKDDKKIKILQLPEQNHFNGVEINSKFNKKLQSGNFNFQPKSKRLNPTKAAIMIQKTWRGYLTRKLLEEYIESFQPLYEQQLKEIRSSRQSCYQIKFTTKRQQRQKSSFFDQSGLEECSEISLLQEGKKVKQSSKRKRNITNDDLPLQLSKKSKTKSIEDEKFTSTQRSIKTIQQKQRTNSNNKVSEFTVKNNFFESQKASSFRQQSTLSLNQQLTKITSRKNKQFSIQNTISQNINPSTSTLSQFQSLHYHCQSLQKLFIILNTECISQLKKQIKKNNLNLKELMQRKDALKDIVENGKEFVRNVLDEMTKAFEEMKRITIKGCANQQSQKSSIQSSQRQVQDQDNESNYKNHTYNNFKQKQFNKNKVSQVCYKQYKHQRQFDNIVDLPTEQYSVKGRSPIQQDYDQNSSGNGSHGYYNDEQRTQHDQNHQHQQQYTQQFNQHQQQESEQQQSLSNDDNQQQYPLHQQSIQILNQFLINLIDEYGDIVQTNKNITQLQYLCQTLKRVSCDSQNKTIIDRCLIQFIVEIMSQTWTLREIYQGFKCIVMKNQSLNHQANQNHQKNIINQDNQQHDYDWKLYSTIRRWLDELQKWEMNIIKEVPSKMESSSFINTAQNISFNQLREQIDSPLQGQNSDLYQYQQY